jgi:hypothetical protein
MRVVYTAVTAGRDTLEPPGDLPPGWRAVCFTDDEAEHPGWEVRPVIHRHGDSVRDARRHKLLPHRYFPAAEISLWLDGNFQVVCDLDALVEECLRRHDLAFHAHPQRDCVYEEAIACINRGKDEPGTIVRQIVRYAVAGYPERHGLPATGVVLRRHVPAVERFNQRWWEELERGSRRDQLAVGWALRREGMEYATFSSDLWKGPLFRFRPHIAALTRRSSGVRSEPGERRPAL